MTYDLNSSVLSDSGYNVNQLNLPLVGTGLAGLGASFLQIESQYGINALFAAAHAAQESAWGNSYLAENRNNLYGINAVDSYPNAAYGYPSKAACIEYYGQFLKTDYLTAGGVYYNGETIHDVFVDYSSSHDLEATNIASIMNEMVFTIGGPTTVSLPVVPSQGTYYTVVAGDNLTSIANAHGLSLARIEQINPQITDPNLIHPGQRVNLVAALATPSAPVPHYYSIEAGDTLTKIASEFGISLAQVEAWNPQITNPNLIYPGQSVRVK
jgi:LysM repeat protein